MGLTVTPINYIQISSCDTLTSGGTWTGNSAGTESDFLKEGIGCLGFTIRVIGNNDINLAGSFNLAGIKHLRIWLLCSTPNAINTENYGIQFYVGDASVTGYYYLGGRASYPGGWYNLVVDLSRPVDAGTKPSNMGALTKVGIRLNFVSAPKNVDNVWIDNLIVCDGLTCESDTPFTLQDIFDQDDALTGGWGIIRKISGIYYLTGKLELKGFSDSGQTMVFEDRMVNSALYGLIAIGDFQLGTKSGTAGISGCSVRTEKLAQTPKFAINGTGISAGDNFKLYGSSFLGARIVNLPANAADREVLNCAFDSCGEVIVDSCIVENCNFISADDEAVVLPSGNIHKVTKSNFISCPNAVRIPAAGEYTFSALKFSGNTIDVDNTSGGAVTVNCENSDPDQGKVTGDTMIVNVKTLTVTGLISGSEVRIYEAGTTNEKGGIENSGTSFGFEYSYAPDVYVDIVVHHLNYEYFRLEDYLLPDASSSIPISQRYDRIYANP